MYLKKLSIINFRNYHRKQIKFDKDLNIIIGKNGSGKTNILESIFLLSTTTSHRTHLNTELIKKEEDGFAVRAEIDTDPGIFNVSIKYEKYGKKLGLAAEINETAVKKNELIQKFPVVFFSPQDIEIINGPPAPLRRMININIAQIFQDYVAELIVYSKILKERNKLLKTSDINEAVLQIWTEMLKKHSIKIIDRRKEFILNINKTIKTESRKMGVKDDISIEYKPFLYNGEKSIKDDLRYGYTTWGSHRDIYDIYKNKISLKNFCSRGELRMIALIYKLSMWELLKQYRNKKPIILLDDVFSELDNENKKILIKRMKEVQIIITAAEMQKEIHSSFNEIKL